MERKSGDVLDMTPEQAANTGKLNGERVLAERIAEEKIRQAQATDGNFYSFSTVQVIRAAEKKWGKKSRRVKALYDLLAEMINEPERI